MIVSAVQMKITDGKPDANRERARLLIEASEGDLFLLPELWTCGYVNDAWAEIADNDTPASLEWMAGLAVERSIWLGGSVIARDDNGSLRNRFVLFNRSGEQELVYDKVHLFRPLQEEVYLEEGASEPGIVDVEGIRVSPLICYDLRFPEMIRKTSLRGVDLFLAVSEWPKPRGYALRTLAEARAVENQAYLALANRIGMDEQGNDFCGASAVLGPNGVLIDADEAETVASAHIDVESLRQFRSSFPVMEHRRPGIDY